MKNSEYVGDVDDDKRTRLDSKIVSYQQKHDPLSIIRFLTSLIRQWGKTHEMHCTENYNAMETVKINRQLKYATLNHLKSKNPLNSYYPRKIACGFTLIIDEKVHSSSE